jgi:hypothetical protein
MLSPSSRDEEPVTVKLLSLSMSSEVSGPMKEHRVAAFTAVIIPSRNRTKEMTFMLLDNTAKFKN